MRVALISGGVVTNVVIATSISAAQLLFPAFECVKAKDSKPGGAPPVFVACYYFGGWKNPPEAQVTWFGSNVWGNSVPNDIFMADYPSHHPLEGDYDEDSQTVIDNQVASAKIAGIDVLLVDWYEERFHTHATDRIPNAQLGTMEWALMWANHYESFDLPQNTRGYLFESCRLAAIRMQDTEYWAINNAPVFVIFSATHLLRCIRKATGNNDSYTPTSQERAELVASMRRVIYNYSAGDVTGGVIGTANSATVSGSGNPDSAYFVLLDSDIGGWGAIAGIDAMSAYNRHGGTYSSVTREAHSFAEISTGCQQYRDLNGPALAAFAPTKKWWPTCTAGWDRRPWGGSVDPLADNALPATASELQTQLSDTRTYCDANANSARTITLYAWNEFGEGGFVAPSVLYGEALRNAVRTACGWAPT